MYYSGMANTPVTSLRIPEKLKERAKLRATAERRSLGNWILKLMEDELADAKPERKARK